MAILDKRKERKTENDVCEQPEHSATHTNMVNNYFMKISDGRKDWRATVANIC